MSVEKYINDGKVAILVSHGFGAGWSTWDEHKEIAYDKRVVEFFLEHGPDVPEESVQEFMTSIGYLNVYCGGYDQLRIEWVPVGTRFVIREYDGDETLKTEDSIDWSIV